MKPSDSLAIVTGVTAISVGFVLGASTFLFLLGMGLTASLAHTVGAGVFAAAALIVAIVGAIGISTVEV